MFNFLKWFKKEKEPEIKELTIELKDLGSWINDLEQKELSDIYKNAEKLRLKANSIFGEVIKQSEHLKNAKSTKDMDPRLKKRVLIGRDNLAEKGSFISKRLLEQQCIITNWKDIMDCKDNYWEALKELTAILSKQREFVKISFKKELFALNTVFKQISLTLKELEDLIESNSKNAETISNLKTDSKNLTETWKNLKSLKKELVEKEKELADLDKNKEILNKKIEQIETSEQFKEKETLKKKLKNIENEKKKIKVHLRSDFSLLNKALKKYLHYSEMMLKKEEVKRIQSYIDEPLNGLISDKSMEILNTFKNMKGLIEKNQLSFDEKSKNRILENIENIQKIFENSKNEWKQITEAEKALQEKINDLHNDDYENALETINVSSKWRKELKPKINELKMKLSEEQQKFLSLKDNILEKLNNQFKFKINILEEK